MPQVMQDDGPVLVDFYLSAVEDRNASIRAGHYVAKDVECVRITPSGGNLVVESEVTDVHKERYAVQYKAFRDGVEPPEEGLALKDWPSISPAQIKTLDAIHIRTVEALSVCSDGALQHAGMGMVALREKAKTYLKNASDHGVVAEEMSALRIENAALKERQGELEAAIEKLSEKPRRGRPPKVQAA